MYLDSAYIAKYYVNEIDSSEVRKLVQGARRVRSTSWAVVEVTAAFHRHVREGWLTQKQAQHYCDTFRGNIEEDIWGMIPITASLLQFTTTLLRGLPPNLALRAGDALHIASALSTGEETLYTNDRHLLKAAAHFGLIAQSVALGTS